MVWMLLVEANLAAKELVNRLFEFLSAFILSLLLFSGSFIWMFHIAIAEPYNHGCFVFLSYDFFNFQFLLELMKVPRVESKLRVFLFKIQFNTQVW